MQVTGLTSGVTAVSAGRWHACVRLSGGGFTCWGDDEEGELGDGREANSSVPVTPNLPPTSAVLIPSNGATQSGDEYLDASASANVASVRFVLTGGALSDKVVSESTPTIYGWIGGWDNDDGSERHLHTPEHRHLRRRRERHRSGNPDRRAQSTDDHSVDPLERGDSIGK